MFQIKYLHIKRLLDVLFATIILVVLGLPISILAISLSFYFKGNPFYLARRSGIFGKEIKVLKLRTMSNKKDKNGNLLPDEMRITRFGTILRQLSIDELPQFVNVLLGNMSIVGPRPLDSHFLDLYDNTQKKRLDVKPGITGLAQVNGRNQLTWKEKFNYDVDYVKKYSFKLDIYIVLKTVKVVIFREGVSQSGYVSAEKFTGNS